MLQEYREVQMGSKPSRKKRENFGQAVTHVRGFLKHMWGQDTPPPAHMRYLDDKNSDCVSVKSSSLVITSSIDFTFPPQ